MVHHITTCMRLWLFTKASAQIANVTSHTRKRYTQFKKYFSKMNYEDRLSKKGNKFVFF